MAKGGDLILWDSRTIHGGLVGDWEEGKGKGEGGRPEGVEEGRMARLTVTACMLPRKKASKLALRKRKEGFEAGRGFNHEANESRVTAYARGEYVAIELTKEQEALL